MLEAGLPVTARGQHRGTPLHWAAWHGNLALVQALLRSNPPLEDAENDFDATLLGWATHGSEHGWHRRTGNYPAVVAALLEAGAMLLETASGTDPVKEVLRPRQQGLNRVSRREPNSGPGQYHNLQATGSMASIRCPR